jgi:hypothetical protein
MSSSPLTLTRQDILKVSPISSNSCLTVLGGVAHGNTSTSLSSSLPQQKQTTEKDRIRVVVGDDSGELHCFSLRRGVVETDFKFRLPQSDGPVRALSHGGGTGLKDKVFVSAEGVVRGVSKKGKEFFSLTTNLAEPLQSLKIDDVHLFGAGEFVFNHFIDGEDKNFVMCPDKVSCLAITDPNRSKSLFTNSSSTLYLHKVLIGCADRSLRVICASNIESELTVEGPVTALVNYDIDILTLNKESILNEKSSVLKASIESSIDSYFVYGCVTGHVGLVKLTEFADKSPSCLYKVFSFTSSATTTSSLTFSSSSTNTINSEIIDASVSASNISAVTSIAVFDSNGTSDTANTSRGGELVVARANGHIEVYASFSNRHLDTSNESIPSCIATATVGELIRSVAVACLTNPLVPEIIVATFSGRIASFSTEAAFAEFDPTDKRGRSKEASQRSYQLASIKKEVEALRSEVANNSRSSSTSSMNTKQSLSTSVASLPLSSTFTLNHVDASWNLSLELPVPIENIVLQSSIPIILPDAIGVEGEDRPLSSELSNKTIISLASSQRVQGIVPGASVLATARSAERSTRMDIRVRALEGRAGELTALVSAIAPTSTLGSKVLRNCSVARFQIKPLCLHVRLNEKVEEVVNKLENTWKEFLDTRKKKSNNAISSTVTDESNYDADDDAASEMLSAALATATRPSQGPSTSPPSSPGGTLEVDRGVSATASSSALSSIAKNITEEKVQGAFMLSALSLTPAQTAPLKSLPSLFPWVVLSLQGNFSLAQIHEWVCGIIPDVPAKMIASSVNQRDTSVSSLSSNSSSSSSSSSSKSHSVSMVFRNVFVGSYLLVEYSAGEAMFRSDNVSSISVLRDALSIASGNARVRLTKNTVDVPMFSMKRILSLLHSRLIFYLTLKLRSELYEGLKELVSASDTSDTSNNRASLGGGMLSPPAFLHNEFADAFANGPVYAAELAGGVSQKAALVTGLVVDAYVDFHKLQGSDVTENIPKLLQLLTQYHTQRLEGKVRVRGSDLVSLFVVKK